jgi:hypothetical protein
MALFGCVSTPELDKGFPVGRPCVPREMPKGTLFPRSLSYYQGESGKVSRLVCIWSRQCSTFPLASQHACGRRGEKKDGPGPVTEHAAGAAAASMPNHGVASSYGQLNWIAQSRQSNSQCSRVRSPARNLPICPIRQADGSTVADPPAGTDISRKAPSPSPQLCRQRQTQGPPWLAGPRDVRRPT